MDNKSIKPVNRIERLFVKKRRKLTREDILLAMRNTKSNMAAARYIGVSYPCYKRYAKMFFDDDGKSLFDKHLNPNGRGIRKFTKIGRAHV